MKDDKNSWLDFALHKERKSSNPVLIDSYKSNFHKFPSIHRSPKIISCLSLPQCQVFRWCSLVQGMAWSLTEGVGEHAKNQQPGTNNSFRVGKFCLGLVMLIQYHFSIFEHPKLTNWQIVSSLICGIWCSFELCAQLHILDLNSTQLQHCTWPTQRCKSSSHDQLSQLNEAKGQSKKFIRKLRLSHW